MFRDRKDAGEELAKKLLAYKTENTLVLALPRGGVPLGYEVAKSLQAPLDIFVVRKIGHPHSPEYAVGAVDDEGNTLFNEREVSGIDKQWLTKEIEKERKEALRRSVAYRSREKIEIAGKNIIVVDDGAATGLTLRLAIKSLRSKKPERIIVALPVAPVEVVEMLAREVDEVVVLKIPEEFIGSVGYYYDNFNQVEDKEVIRLLGEQ